MLIMSTLRAFTFLSSPTFLNLSAKGASILVREIVTVLHAKEKDLSTSDYVEKVEAEKDAGTRGDIQDIGGSNIHMEE